MLRAVDCEDVLDVLTEDDRESELVAEMMDGEREDDHCADRHWSLAAEYFDRLADYER